MVAGLHRAQVTRVDPEDAKVRLQVPSVLGSAESPWADPLYIDGETPSVGQQVWVGFEAGDSSKPVWMRQGSYVEVHDHDDLYYTKDESDALYLTESEADTLFLTEAEADALYSDLGHLHDDRYIKKSGQDYQTIVGKELSLEWTSPQLRFFDTDVAGAGRNFWWHLNGGTLHLLADLNGDDTWQTPHPIQVNGSQQRVNIGWPMNLSTKLTVDNQVLIGVTGSGNFPFLKIRGNAQQVVIEDPANTAHQWQFEALSDNKFYLKHYDGAYNTMFEVTKTGQMTITGQLLLPTENDVGTNTGGALVIGPLGGPNIRLDSNEIASFSSTGAPEVLHLQHSGAGAGPTHFGGALVANGRLYANAPLRAQEIEYLTGSGLRVADTGGNAHSWFPHTAGNFWFTSRPDLGSGHWYFRTYNAGSYSTKLQIDQNGRIVVPFEFASAGTLRVENVTYGTRIGAHSMLANITFSRNGTLDEVILEANDYINSPTIYARGTTGGDYVRIGSDGKIYRYSSSLKIKQGWEFRPDIVDVDLPDPISWPGREDVPAEQGRTFLGFGAEHAAEAMPLLASHGDDGEPLDIDDRAILAVVVAKIKRLEEVVGV